MTYLPLVLYFVGAYLLVCGALALAYRSELRKGR
jgi:hypothetical protein